MKTTKIDLFKSNPPTKYCKWLKSGFNVKELEGGSIDIITPFLDCDGAPIIINAFYHNEELILSDNRDTLDSLEAAGFDTENEKNMELVQTILDKYGVDMFEDAITTELYVSTDESFLPQAIHSFLQCLLAINAISVVYEFNKGVYQNG